MRDRAGELRRDTATARPASRSASGLADADDRDEPGAPGGGGLVADVGVGLAVGVPALGVADDPWPQPASAASRR